MASRSKGSQNGYLPCRIDLPQPDCKTDAEHWVFQWPTPAPEGKIRIEVNGLREHSEGITSEITLHHVDRTQPIYGPSKLNLMSGESKKRLANELDERWPAVLWHPPEDYMPNNEAESRPHEVKLRWRDLLDRVSAEVIRLSREGNPVLDAKQNVTTDGVVYYLIDKLLPLDQTTVIYCDGGVGKSWLGEYLAIIIAVLHFCEPFVVQRHRKVLYLDYESGKAEFDRRLLYIEHGLGITVPDGMLFYRKQERGIADDLQRLRQEIARLDIGCVVVDSLGPASGSAGNSDILKPDQPIKTMDAISNLANADHPLTKLVLAHISKGEAREDGRSTIYGSAFFTNLARATWEFKRTRARLGGLTTEAALIQTKINVGRKMDPIGFAYHWNDIEHSFKVEPLAVLDNPDLAKHEGIEYEIESHLRTGPKAREELAGLCNVKKGLVWKTLDAMIDNAKVAKGSRKLGTRGRPSIVYFLAERRAEYQDIFAEQGTLDESAEEADDEPDDASEGQD